jgi:cell division septation protein DedD
MGPWIARQRPSLPPGYRVEETDATLRLFDADGALRAEGPRGRAAARALESQAWQEAWERIEGQVADDLRALRGGTRSIHDLRRLRQYRRMLEAVAAAPDPLDIERRRSRWISGFAIGTAAAVLAAAILTGPPVVPEVPVGSWQPAPGSGGRSVARAPASPAEAAGRRSWVRGGPAAVRPAPNPPARPPRPVARALAVRYIVSLGEFATQGPAEVRMRLVRSKGHVVYVARIGDTFHVVTKPFQSREYAERLAVALQEIGLPARAQVASPELL